MMPEARLTIQHPVRFTKLLYCNPPLLRDGPPEDPLATIEYEEFRLARDVEQEIDGFLRMSTGQWLPLTEGMGLDQEFVFPPAPKAAPDLRYRPYPEKRYTEELDRFYAGTYVLR